MQKRWPHLSLSGHQSLAPQVQEYYTDVWQESTEGLKEKGTNEEENIAENYESQRHRVENYKNKTA